MPASGNALDVTEYVNDAGTGGFVVAYTRTFRVYATPQPTFTVKPCLSNSAQVTVSDTNYNSYTVQAGSNPAVSITPNVPLNINTTGATSITVTGSYTAPNICKGTQTVSIPPLAPAQVPQFSRLTLQNPLPTGPASLVVGQLPAGYNYKLQLDTGSGFADLTTVPEGSTTFSLLSPSAGCYRILRTDACGGNPAPSPVICTLSLTVSSIRNRNILALSDAGAPNTTYIVTRNGTALPGVTFVNGRWEDTDVQCGTDYTYVVTATQPASAGGLSVSNTFSIRTVSDLPPAQPRLVASFNLNDVVVLTPSIGSPALPAGSMLRYRRTAGSQSVDFAPEASLRPRRDSTSLVELRASPPCYSLRIADVCSNTSPESTAACPSLLTASPADAEGNTISLTWTPFSGPDPSIPATYAFQRLAADGTVLSTVPISGSSATDLTPANDQAVRYRLQISGAGLPAGTFSYSNRATVIRRLTLTIPTAFTPNGDGLNDVLEVKGKYLKNYLFVVVDRNGQEVFRGTQRSETWDGSIRGHAPVNGAYVWRFQQNEEDGKTFSATGTVTILK